MTGWIVAAVLYLLGVLSHHTVLGRYRANLHDPSFVPSRATLMMMAVLWPLAVIAGQLAWPFLKWLTEPVPTHHTDGTPKKADPGGWPGTED